MHGAKCSYQAIRHCNEQLEHPKNSRDEMRRKQINKLLLK